MASPHRIGSHLRAHLTYANVVLSLLAVIVFGGGVAWAFKIKIVPGAVTTAKLKDGAVTNGKIAPGAVQTRHIADRAVTGPKIAFSAATAEKLNPSVYGAFMPRGSFAKVSFSPSVCDGGTSNGCARDALDFAGLKLHAACAEVNTEGNLFEVLTVTADGTGVVNVSGQGGQGNGPVLNADRDVQGGFGTPGTAFAVSAPDGASARLVGRLIYHDDSSGRNVHVLYSGYAVHTADHRCELFGSAEST